VRGLSRWWSLVLPFVVVVFALPSVARAQEGSPAITPSRMVVHSILAPGGEYDIPSVVVRNGGSTAMPVRMSTQADDAEVASWVSYTPEVFDVPAGGTQVVRVTLRVPRDAELRDHRVRARAGAVRGSEDGQLGVGVSVGVASIIDFEVGAPEGGAALLATRSGLGLGVRYLPLALVVGIAAGILGFFAARFVSERRIALRLDVSKRDSDAGSEGPNS